MVVAPHTALQPVFCGDPACPIVEARRVRAFLLPCCACWGHAGHPCLALHGLDWQGRRFHVVYGKWISLHPGIGVGARFIAVAVKRAAPSGGGGRPSITWWMLAEDCSSAAVPAAKPCLQRTGVGMIPELQAAPATASFSMLTGQEAEEEPCKQ